ncbi:antibiotic biosynthesis monooxygenase [Sulfuriferula nivalis]|uniref:Antibiotic biosynthesis monooxygenase n=1 Tax=Sulfuriferula nivalis TaxID=2675298 RepID=A0A809RM14_9PROT|nr:antibiotic biosynthesis monooxygenase [Sulfuriferula nivalis]
MVWPSDDAQLTLGVKVETAMILEVAILNVRAGEGVAFEQAFSQAQDIISSMPGYASHQLQRCLESQEKYLLLVQWQRLEDHTIGFRQSQQYQEWKQLLHHFYEPFPTVEHYELVATNGAIAVQPIIPPDAAR